MSGSVSLGSPYIPVLSSADGTRGFIRLVATMGNDQTIVWAARQTTSPSSSREDRSLEEDARLIRYMMQHGHTSPFEFCEAIFQVECPIFVARQWMRHRTGVFNEYSQRYSPALRGSYIPPSAQWRAQPEGKRQTSWGMAPPEERRDKTVRRVANSAQAIYKKLLSGALGGTPIAREQARAILPTGTWTRFAWKVDLHNLLHFVHLRCSHDAQPEIQEYAVQIRRMLETWVPLTYHAWLETKHTAVTLTQTQQIIVNLLVNQRPDLAATHWEKLSSGDRRTLTSVTGWAGPLPAIPPTPGETP